MEILKIVFPLLMVAGALGSLVVNFAWGWWSKRRRLKNARCAANR